MRNFLAQGMHGDMGWMAARPERRGDPRTLWPQVRAIVMLGVNYGPTATPWRRWRGATAAPFRSMPTGDDYHDVIKPRLKRSAAG